MTIAGLDYRDHDIRAVDERLAYASFVSARHRLLFVETPKACSSTMKWILADLSGAEVPHQLAFQTTDLAGCIHDRSLHSLPALTALPSDEALEALTSPDYVRVCAVRNPYTRLVSAWADKIRLIEPGHEEDCRAALAHTGRQGGDEAPTFREFATWVVDTNDPAHCEAHWREQTALLYPDLIDYNFVIRAETFEQDLQALLARIEPGRAADAAALVRSNTHNVGLPVRWSQTYDEALAAQVAAFYAPTFHRFGYDPESWKELVARPDPKPASFEAAALKALRIRNATIAEWDRQSREPQRSQANWSATSRAKAAARWLMRRFSSGSSSAKVRS